MLAVAGLIELFGIGSDAAFTLVMWLGFAGLVAGSAVLARRWAGVPWWAALAPLALMPGVFESQFFFNDNMLAAGLFATGLALLGTGPSWRWLPVGGILLGLAVLTRTDTLLVGVAAPILLYRRFGPRPAALGAMLVTGGAAAAALLLPLALLGASILDIFTTGRTAVQLWDRSNGLGDQLEILIYFIGLPGVALAALGVGALARRRDPLLLALVAAPPLLSVAVLYGTLWEVRQLLVLTPFLATLAAAGLASLATSAGLDRAGFAAGAAAAALTAVALLAPVRGIDRHDGPRVITGRVAAIALWRDWQRSVHRDFATLDAAAALAAPGRPLVLLSDYWNEDRYLHLVLLERGLRPDPRPLPSRACDPVAERFAANGAEVIHLRLHQSYAPAWRELQGERVARWALPCLRAIAGARPILLLSRDRAEDLLGTAAAGAEPEPPLVAWLSYGPILALPLDPGMTPRLLEGYAADGAKAAAEERTARPVPSAQAALAVTRSRTRLFRRD